MVYKNGIFALQNMESAEISAYGTDATILYMVLVSMMNTHIELQGRQVADAFFAMGGNDFGAALQTLTDNGYVAEDTDDIFIIQGKDKPLEHEYHVGVYTFHFNIYGPEANKAFAVADASPLTRSLPERVAPAAASATYAPQPKLTSITITADGVYKAPEGYDGFDAITVKTKPDEPWRLQTGNTHYVFLKAKYLRHFHKLLRGMEAPATLSDGARILWNYLVSPSATHLLQLFAPRVNKEIGMSAEEISKAAAELHGYGYLFFDNNIEGAQDYTYSLFTDHIIDEDEWRDYERRITEEHDSYERAKRLTYCDRRKENEN